MLYIADEVFFTGTAAEITPLRSIDRIKVGAGKRGPVTKRLQEEFFAILTGAKPDRHNWLTPVALARRRVCAHSARSGRRSCDRCRLIAAPSMYSRPQKLAAEFLGTFARRAVQRRRDLRRPIPQRRTNGSGLGPLGHRPGLWLGLWRHSSAAMGRISGGHFNPAVTIGFWVTRRLGTFDTLTYCVAQLAGACARRVSAALGDSRRDLARGGAGHAGSGQRTHARARHADRGPADVSPGVRVLRRLRSSIADASRPLWQALATGLLITAAALFGGPFTGAAMNPARAFGPALASRHWTNHGVYWVGPLAGGAGRRWDLRARSSLRASSRHRAEPPTRIRSY